jgi:hypothetical protein
MSLGMNMGIRLGGASGFSVSRFLSGGKGAAWDFRRQAGLGETTTAGDVIADDPIGRIEGVGGTAGAFSATTTQRPTWKTTHALFDGVANRMDADATANAVFQNVGAGMIAISAELANLTSSYTLCAWRNGSTGAARFAITILATGAVRISLRRLDADAQTDVTSATGLITAGVPFKLVTTVDWLTGGAGSVRAYLDGTSIINGTLAGTGATENTASQTSRLFTSTAAGVFTPGKCVSLIAVNKIPTDSERASLFAAI